MEAPALSEPPVNASIDASRLARAVGHVQLLEGHQIVEAHLSQSTGVARSLVDRASCTCVLVLWKGCMKGTSS